RSPLPCTPTVGRPPPPPGTGQAGRGRRDTVRPPRGSRPLPPPRTRGLPGVARRRGATHRFGNRPGVAPGPPPGVGAARGGVGPLRSGQELCRTGPPRARQPRPHQPNHEPAPARPGPPGGIVI